MARGRPAGADRLYGGGTATLKLSFGLTSGLHLRRAHHVPNSVTSTIQRSDLNCTFGTVFAPNRSALHSLRASRLSVFTRLERVYIAAKPGSATITVWRSDSK